MKHCTLLIVLLVDLALGVTGWAQTGSGSSDPIGQQLDSKDPTQIQQAVATISDRLAVSDFHDRRVAVLGLTKNGHWLKKLMVAQQYDAVAQLTTQATLALPSDVSLIEYLQWYRAQALLNLGKPQQALAAAKGLFNVTRMETTANAVKLIVDCLKTTYSNDATIIDRFRQEQVAGADLSPSSVVSPQSSVLGRIKIDGSAYDAAIQKLSTGTTYASLVSLGNLLLLADRAREAETAFRQASALAKDKTAASENIARAIRAEDGTIGRANAWLLSIQPK